MPFGNGTGPNGMGPMTGRGAGYCAGFGVPGYINNAVPRRGGAGFGMGGRGWFGGGRGFRNRFWAGGAPSWGRGAFSGGAGAVQYPPYAAPGYAADPDVARENELNYLKQQLEAMQSDSEAIRVRIEELEKESVSDSD